MFTNSEIAYGYLILWVIIVVSIVGGIIYSIYYNKSTKVSEELRTTVFIVSGMFFLIVGVVLLLILTPWYSITDWMPWNEYKVVLLKILMFRKLNLPPEQQWINMGIVYYAAASSGLILFLIGVARIVMLKTSLSGERVHFYIDTEIKHKKIKGNK